MSEVEGDMLADVPSLLSEVESDEDVTSAGISKLQDNFPRVAYTGGYRSGIYCLFFSSQTLSRRVQSCLTRRCAS